MPRLPSIFGRKATPVRRFVPAQTPRTIIRGPVRASYDAAKTTDHNQRHWANADNKSADAAGKASVRKTLRQRSRYEYENNPYARGLALTMANYVIGQGPKLQALTPDTNGNRQIEASFNRWAHETKLAQKLRTARISQAISGDVFLQFATSERLAAVPGVPTLDLKLIEADQVDTPWSDVADSSVTNGVRLDKDGNPSGYIVLSQHPGDSGVALPTGTTVPADMMIHLFRPDRPGQNRGVPEFAAALETFAQLRRYMQAVLSAAERAAEVSLYFKTDAPPGEGAQVADDGTELGDLPAIEPRRNEAIFLPEGWDPFQLKAEQPTAEFAATVHQYLAEIGRVLQVPVMIVTGDASDHNFASGRLDYQAFLRMIDVDRSDIERDALHRIVDAWYAEARLMDNLLPRDAPATLPRQWYWPGIEHVDELKASKAAETRILSGLSSIQTEQARAGYDWEDQQRQQAEALGLSLEDYRRRLADKMLGPDTNQPPKE